MATWKKILREDYAVGATDGLINFTSEAASQVLTLKLNDQRSSPSDGTGLESVALTFSNVFTVGANSISFPTLTFSDGTNNITRLDVAANETITFGSSDSSITITANDGAGTIDLTAASSTITGNVDGDDDSNPDTATFNLGDGITFTSSSLDILVSEASEVITIDLEVGTTTITGTEDSSTDNYTAGTDNITFASYTTNSVGVKSNVSGTTVSLGVLKEDIQDVVGAMVTGNTEQGIGVTYQDADGTLDFVLNNLSLTGNTTAQGAAITYNSSPGLSITGATNSGITVAAANNAFTIDQVDVTITGTDGTNGSATLSPTSGITFTSTDGSVSSAITGGGDGTAVTVDLEATPTVTNIGDVATDTSETYNITMTSATGTGDYVAFMDVGALQWKITDSSGSESAELIVNGDLTVTGTTTTLQTENVIVEDKLITLANPDTGDGTTTSATGGGIEVKSGAATVAYPSIVWNNTGELSGWQVQDHATLLANKAPKEIATMQFEASTAPATAVKRGDFYYETDTDILYVCIGS